jgi:hypothetical protein
VGRGVSSLSPLFVPFNLRIFLNYPQVYLQVCKLSNSNRREFSGGGRAVG